MKTLYFDCFAGLAGDMAVAALCHMAGCADHVKERLTLLGIDHEFEVEFAQTMKNGISATRFIVTEKHHHHDHDDHHHHHNDLEHITHLIDHSGLNQAEKDMAINIFNKVAVAEGRVHGLAPEQVHFHEVGAIDSIIDILAFSICIDYIKPDAICFSTIREGSGSVTCQHGVIPVPAPATLEIIRENALVVEFTDIKGEMLTPTGAAIAAIGHKTGAACPMGKITKVGYGAGFKDFEHPNVVRAMLVEHEQELGDTVCQLCANIDDSTGEQLGFAAEILMEQGALDVFYTPVFGKKNRPAYMLTLLCKEPDRASFEQLILKHTSTLGVRGMAMERAVLTREIIVKQTKFGEIRVKKTLMDGAERLHPEYEDVKNIAKTQGLTITQVLELI